MSSMSAFLFLACLASVRVTLEKGTVVSNGRFEGVEMGIDDRRPQGSGELQLLLCVFVSNQGGQGGAIYSVGIDSLVVESCEFSNTEATDKGGAIYVGPEASGVNCRLTNDKFVDATAGKAGGAVWIKCETTTVDLCHVKGCRTDAEGSAGSSVYIYYETQDPVKIKSTIFENGQENVEYVIYPFVNFYASLEVYNCTFDGTGKTVKQFCFFDRDYTDLKLELCIFTNLEVTSGGAFSGCTISNSESLTMIFQHCRFESITGKNAAAIVPGKYGGELKIDNCTFVNCTPRQGDRGAGVLRAENGAHGFLKFKNTVVDGCCRLGGAVIWIEDKSLSSSWIEFTFDNLSVVNHGNSGKSLCYVGGRTQSTGDAEKEVVFKRLYISDFTLENSVLIDMPRNKVTYQDCIFTDVTRSKGEFLLRGAWTYSGNLELTTSAINCSFIRCHANGGAILFWLDNGGRATNWTRVAVTDCKFISCTAKNEIVVMSSVKDDQKLSKAEVTGTQFVDCEVPGSVSIVRLEPQVSWVFESNNVTGVLPDAPISLGTATEDMNLFGCSFDNAGSALRGGYLNFLNGDYKRVTLEKCHISNVVMSSENVFLFLAPKPASLEELQLVDCVFDGVTMTKVSMITAVKTLVVNGSTFRSCTSPTGVINLDEQETGVAIERCVFDANERAADGQSVYLKFSTAVQASSLNISDTVFSNHEKYAPFSAKLAGPLTVFQMSNCTFSNNKITDSLGVLCFDGSNIEYTFSECVFSECSVESAGGQLIWIPSTEKAFSQFALRFCEFTSCGSGSVIGSTSEQNGDLIVENCSVINGGFSLAFSCSSASFSKCHFMVGDSTAEAVIKLSAHGETVFSDSTFVFVDNAADTKSAMIQYVGGSDAKVTFRDCCFATDVIPASQFVAFLSLEGQGSYTFEGAMCFDLPNSRAVRANRGIVGSDESMFACGTCTRRGGDLNDDGSDPAKKGQLPPAAIAGIVIVVLLILILLLLLALYIIRKRRYADFSTTHAEEEENPEETITTTADTTSGGGYAGPGFMSEENPLWKEDAFQSADQTFEEHVV